MICRIGDLAVVIRSRNVDSLGAIVEVVRPFHRHHRADAGPMWWVRSTGRLLKAVGGFSGENVLCREGAIEDRHLRPIGGVPDDTVVEHQVTA